MTSQEERARAERLIDGAVLFVTAHNRQKAVSAMLAFAAEERERCALICDGLADTAAMIQAAVELSGGEAPTKSAQREAAETLAAAIRAQGGGRG